MAGKPKGPIWFKLWAHQKPMMDVLPDEVLGRSIKAAMHYFVSGEVPALGQLELVAFSSIKSSMDEAFADYERDVENGKKGGRPKRNGNKKPPVMEADLPHPLEQKQKQMQKQMQMQKQRQRQKQKQIKRGVWRTSRPHPPDSPRQGLKKSGSTARSETTVWTRNDL